VSEWARDWQEGDIIDDRHQYGKKFIDSLDP
jgi:hypothetical protein